MLDEFRVELESQTPRQLRRYLDYGKCLKRGDDLDDLYQWLGKILLDDGRVYADDERALAFEIGVGECIAELLEVLEATPPVVLFLGPSVDRLFIYAGILDENAPLAHRATFFRLLGERYGKHAAWIEEINQMHGGEHLFSSSSGGRLFSEFYQRISSEITGFDIEGASPLQEELDEMRAAIVAHETTIKTLESDLEFAEDRAHRAHQRLKSQDGEAKQLRKLLNDERENGEKLRGERRTRIQSQRQSNKAQKDLEHLRREYVKLDARLQDMAERLALSQHRRQADAPRSASRWDLASVRQLSLSDLLGVEQASSEDLSTLRRRFAAALHPDRVRGLPQWVGVLFAEVLGVINEACDRINKNQGQ